jgi:hypothetical protein
MLLPRPRVAISGSVGQGNHDEVSIVGIVSLNEYSPIA